ncbi:hypothetical protein [Streptomyces chartreusis]|uniref:hypothetical protein n=1 Tax=Streptomyces chartreusis TaxID=1969 RepID=UPI002E802043|nr:hypothetical protein [Streptomyces chartreusis]WUB15311.1 hypothetical protein OG997_00775 [Streptomyces chartreusis]
MVLEPLMCGRRVSQGEDFDLGVGECARDSLQRRLCGGLNGLGVGQHVAADVEPGDGDVALPDAVAVDAVVAVAAGVPDQQETA